MASSSSSSSSSSSAAAAPAYSVPTAHRLHAAYSAPLLQAWSSAPPVAAAQLVWPLFLVEDEAARQPIAALPGQSRWGCGEARLREALEGPVRDGLRAVLLFGVLDDGAKKDARGGFADSEASPVVKALRTLRRIFPSLLLMADVCLCAFTEHGHCGILTASCVGAAGAEGASAAGAGAGAGAGAALVIDNDASVARLAAVATAYARAGAHVVAPSDMMDGRVGVIKAALRAAGVGGQCAVMSYAAKFASCFYGPFRDAAHSGMSFGDRTLYQLPPASRSLALRAVARDVAEGADFVMVKPGMAYLDVCRDVVERAGVPVAVYQVSGEYAMLWHAAAAGAFDLRRAVDESMQAFARAGVGIVISYFTPQLLAWAAEDAERARAARAARA